MLFKIERWNNFITFLGLQINGPEIVTLQLCSFGEHDHTLGKLTFDLFEIWGRGWALIMPEGWQDDSLQFGQQGLRLLFGKQVWDAARTFFDQLHQFLFIDGMLNPIFYFRETLLGLLQNIDAKLVGFLLFFLRFLSPRFVFLFFWAFPHSQFLNHSYLTL